ncbi:MAG: hypothetical protein Q8900_05090 [Bacillota bacterium]|nr:hypothetical protein [Bacillota bacterium]
MKNTKYILCICIILILSLCFSGCNVSALNLKQKVNIKNADFEYIKQGKIRTITIQSTRDKSYKFIITDQRTISDLYDILSSAKAVSSKSSLDPDYIFELHESSNKIYTFKYVSSLNDFDSGNFYSDNKIYSVSSKIDDNIISSFSALKRTPKNFNGVYYEGILEILSMYGKRDNKKIGVDISSDFESLKFVISANLESFNNKLVSIDKNMELKKDNKNYDVIANVKTQGYKSDRYKIIITFTDSTDNSETKYYMDASYKNDRWNFDIFTSSDTDKVKSF